MWLWLSAILLANDVVGSRSAETCEEAAVYSAKAGPLAGYRRTLLERDVIDVGHRRIVKDRAWIETILSGLTGLTSSSEKGDWRRLAEVRIVVRIVCRVGGRLVVGIPESMDWVRMGKVILEAPSAAFIRAIVREMDPSPRKDWCLRYPWACPGAGPEPNVEEGKARARSQ